MTTHTGSASKRPLKLGLHLPETERIAPWTDMAEMCRLAEDVGFDSIWVPDHLLYRFPEEDPKAPWECWSILSAVAAVTKRVEIGPLVLCTSFREPGLVAKMADTIDEISGGRLILGLGCGWHQPEYEAFGFPYATRVGRFGEAFTIIRTLLADGKIDFEGKYYTLRECELRPRGPRPEGPPLMIGARGEQMLRMSLPHVTYWNGWYAWSGNTIEGYQNLHSEIDRAVTAAGRDLADVGRTMAVETHMPGHDGSHDPRATPLSGTPEELAVWLTRLAAAGVSHAQIVLAPNTCASIEHFAKVIEILDRGDKL